MRSGFGMAEASADSERTNNGKDINVDKCKRTRGRTTKGATGRRDLFASGGLSASLVRGWETIAGSN